MIHAETISGTITSEGWLIEAAHIPSPNFDERPENVKIDLIVIHNISLPPGEFGGHFIDQLFTNTLNPQEHPYFQTISTLRVSSHILIHRLGDVVQYVSFNKRAWHAGQSNYQGRERCNDFAIGIELEGTDDTPYTDAQYQQLALLIQLLWAHYPTLKPEHLTGHSDIAPGRKTDPGLAFDWPRLRQMLHDVHDNDNSV
ncbi:MAG: 1,6-anhydro-N-acetylmuramyl-L-alanine amidase AmpD [Pseudomonadota bacterium]